MTPLVSFKNSNDGVTYIVTSKITGFQYEYQEDITLVWVDADPEPYRFKGKHDDDIIAAIHGWEE